MKKKKVLFICIHNSARSQMAEAFLNHLAGERYCAESAGLEPGVLNPVVVVAMKEMDIDISQNVTKGVSQFLDNHTKFDYVITVCDETSAGRCPFFPGSGKRLHWSFPDPSGFDGGFDEKLTLVRQVRDAIREKIEGFIASQR